MRPNAWLVQVFFLTMMNELWTLWAEGGRGVQGLGLDCPRCGKTLDVGLGQIIAGQKRVEARCHKGTDTAAKCARSSSAFVMWA